MSPSDWLYLGAVLVMWGGMVWWIVKSENQAMVKGLDEARETMDRATKLLNEVMK